MEQQRTGLAIMRPTEECNLACKYCYSTRSSPLKLMEGSTLENAIRKILEFYSRVTFVWHGGEATLGGLDFFRGIVKIQKQYRVDGQKVINEIQTNGTLIDADWAEFFRENSFYVGVSIDGPQRINNTARIDADGKGAHDQILRGIHILQKHGITVAGICVLANHNIAAIEKVMAFYEKEGLPLNINPFISSGIGYIYRHSLQPSPREYGEAMIKLFDLWFRDPTVKIYDFYKIIKSFFTGLNNICCFSGKCSKEYISVCPNGDVYPCGRWAGEKEFKMGNINDDRMEKIINSRPAELLSQRGSHLQKCQACQWFGICNGGCPHTSYLYTGEICNEDFYCEGRKMLFEHIYSVVSSHIQRYRQAQIAVERR